MYVTKEHSLEESLHELDYESLYRTSELVDEYSIEYALELMKNKLSKKIIEIEQYYHFYGDVFWKKSKSENNKNPKFYYVTKIDAIKDKLKDILYNYNNYDDKSIYKILIDNSNEIGNSDALDTMKLRDK